MRIPRPSIRRPGLRSGAGRSSGARPGLLNTLRHGWKPARKRSGTPLAAKREPATGAPPGPAGTTTKPAATPPELAKRRDELSKQFAELQWDLGGITYEMARRDNFRPEVINRKASELQKVDAELGQIERIVKLDQQGAAGTCPSCGSLQARGARFCWHCGKELSPSSTSTQTPGPSPTETPPTPPGPGPGG